MARAMPESHRALLASLALSHEDEHAIYVHAGLNPDLDRDAQSPSDMLWIREKFLCSARDWGKPVVHGHTPNWTGPEVTGVRLNLDTGAFHSGFLTCAALSSDVPRFLVGARPSACHLLVDRDGRADAHWIAWVLAAVATSGAREVLLCGPAPGKAHRECRARGLESSVIDEDALVAGLADPEERLGALRRRCSLAIHYAGAHDQNWLASEVSAAARRFQAAAASK
jgi:diadenosine tetraphosphatase ApaH/serine/threonine PP2A family protein phosphatase